MEVLVLGGGAAGLMAAIAAARGGAKVTVLEAGERVGKKLLSTGNGRCNLSNMAISPSGYGKDLEGFLLTPERMLGLFSALGLETKADGAGRVYPLSDTATSVLDVLRLALERLGVELLCGFAAQRVQREEDGYRVFSVGGRSAKADRLVLCCGSKAASKADGYGLLKELGHTMTPIRPGLCPILTDEALTRGLRGVRAQCSVSLIFKNKQLMVETGELLFKDGQLSGIAVFNLSRGLPEEGKAEVSVDLLPGWERERVLSRLWERRVLFKDLSADGFFTGLFHKQIGAALLKRAGISQGKVSALSDAQMDRLAGLIKDWRFPALGTPGWETAQIARGGVPLSQVCPSTMESRLLKGLHIAGEMLDADGPCGGYNLHFAFSTGYLAGQAAAQKQERVKK